MYGSSISKALGLFCILTTELFTDLTTLSSSFLIYLILKILHPASIQLLTLASERVSFLIIEIVSKYFSSFESHVNYIILQEAIDIFSAKAITYLIIGVFMIVSTDALISLIPILFDAATVIIRRVDLFRKRDGRRPARVA